MLEYVQFYLIPHQLSGVARSGFQSGICIRVGWSLGCKFYYYVFFLSIQEHCCGQLLVLLYFVFIFKFKIPLIEVYRNFYLGENPGVSDSLWVQVSIVTYAYVSCGDFGGLFLTLTWKVIFISAKHIRFHKISLVLLRKESLWNFQSYS